MGTTPDEVLTIDSGQRVSLEGSELARSSIADPDLCNPGQVLLFLKRTALPGIYTYAPQGWVRIEGDLIEPAPFSKAFQDYAGAQALLAGIRRIAEEQQAQGLPKGLLVCQSKHTSDTYRDPIVCPGDSFNPYQAFRLGTVSAAFVITTDPGPSDLALSRTDLKYDSPQLTAIMAALDVEVTLDPGGFRPDDLISLQVFTTEPVNERASYLFWYSPSSAMMQMVGSGGQFPAPPAFQLAMEPFLTVP
ncbi:MAG: hypothetical protein IH959_00685 [Chloroflexi bacterium]|nr:hypothetical protein [Chloroflexota bacterium]